MNQRRFAEARILLEPAVLKRPDSGPARQLLGAALRFLGEADAAERELRAALAIDPNSQTAATELARLFNALGRFEDAVEISTTASAAQRPSEGLLAERARAFHALDQMDDRLVERERIVALYPGKASSHHNLAAALGDAGHAEQAEAAAQQTFALGGDAPETWLVLARALQSQNRFDEAEAAFAQAVRRRAGYTDALRDHAQLIWMRTGDLEKALAPLNELPSGAEAPRLQVIKARLFEAAGDPRGGYDLLTREAATDPEIQITAAHLALGFDPSIALAHAQRAEILAPGADGIQRKLIDVLLAVGRAEEALTRIETRLTLHPLDQGLIAAQWMAWRASGDPRADALYDYDAFVLAQTIDTPAGWRRLDDFLADLSSTLKALHQLQAHPLDQSLRHGTQTSVNLLKSDDAVIRAFIEAIDDPIRRYMAFIGAGSDRLRARNTQNYRLKGMWSVKLLRTGFHVNHVHPMGWLSSACYIEVPDNLDETRREGWIKFGEPGIPTSMPMDPEHFVRPSPGRLVMFPSYMWHGTVPFSTAGSRVTLAFDVVPA